MVQAVYWKLFEIALSNNKKHGGNMTLQELEALTVPEKIQLAEDLWDSVAKSNAQMDIPEWQKRELDQRKKDFLDKPDSGMSRQSVKKSVLESNV